MSRSWTGWFAPWCPNRSRRVSAPAARPTIWCPRQMPSSGRPSSMTDAGERDRTVEPGGIAGPGREHDPRDVRGEDVGRGGGVGQDADPHAAPAERADDVRLEPEVDDRDQWRRRVVADLTHRGRRDLGDEVLVLPALDGAGAVDGRGVVGRTGLGDDPAQRPARAQVAGEGPGVDAGDRRDGVRSQHRRELAGVVEDRRRRVGDHEAAQPGPGGLVVVLEAPVVPDQRVGHHDDLPRVRGIGRDLLVPGLRGVDDEVAAGRDGGTERDAGEHGPVLQREQRGSGVADAGVDDRIGTRQRRMTKGRWGDHGFPACRGVAPQAGMRMRTWLPPTRPHGTGTPASRDRQSGCGERTTRPPADGGQT